MPLLLLRVVVFAAAFILFVPVRWRVWGGRLRNHRWKFLSITFGEMVDRERARPWVSITAWAMVIALLTFLST